MGEPYARTRMDALRHLMGEGYAVVDAEGYRRLRGVAGYDEPAIGSPALLDAAVSTP